MSASTPTDWAAWSRDAVQLLQKRNADWTAKWNLTGASYSWDLPTGKIRFRGKDGDVIADLSCVGTASRSEATFLWSWANDAIPEAARKGIERVREFGRQNDLPLLTTSESPGGEAEGKEIVAIAARILDAEGVWIERSGDLILFFALCGFRRPA